MLVINLQQKTNADGIFRRFFAGVSKFNPYKPYILFYGTWVNSEEPDQMPKFVVSDLKFASRIFYQNFNKNEKYKPTTLKLEMGSFS